MPSGQAPLENSTERACLDAYLHPLVAPISPTVARVDAGAIPVIDAGGPR
jgi:hypothetical protein